MSRVVGEITVDITQRPEPCESCTRPLQRVTLAFHGQTPRRAFWEVYGMREHTAQWCRAARGRSVGQGR